MPPFGKLFKKAPPGAVLKCSQTTLKGGAAMWADFWEWLKKYLFNM